MYLGRIRTGKNSRSEEAKEKFVVLISPWGLEESDTTERLHFHFHFHALEKEMATHSSILAWRIPGTGEPGGLPSMGSHGVRHDWIDLAAAGMNGEGQNKRSLGGKEKGSADESLHREISRAWTQYMTGEQMEEDRITAVFSLKLMWHVGWH